MAKKTVDAQSLALEALAAALADPTPRVLFGTAAVPGFFKGATQPVKAAAQLCEERQWLAATDEWQGKGKSRKPKYRLTPQGAQAVLDHGQPLVILRTLAEVLKQQSDTFRALNEHIGRLLGSVEPLRETVSMLAKRLEPPNVAALVRGMQAPTSPAPSSNSADWLDAAVNLASQQVQRDRYQPLSLPQLYATLKQTRPGLTLGEFHDGLRLLRDRGRIRLAPFTRALATIDDPRNALFLDGEVMYYVELP
jgi:hypothetical protein